MGNWGQEREIKSESWQIFMGRHKTSMWSETDAVKVWAISQKSLHCSIATMECVNQQFYQHAYKCTWNEQPK